MDNDPDTRAGIAELPEYPARRSALYRPKLPFLQYLRQMSLEARDRPLPARGYHVELRAFQKTEAGDHRSPGLALRLSACRAFLLAEGVGQLPNCGLSAVRRLPTGQQGHLAPAIRFASGEFRQRLRVVGIVGEMTGRQVFLQGAVGDGVYLVSVRDQQPRAELQEVHDPRDAHLRCAPRQVEQPGHQRFLGDIGRSPQVGLGFVCFVGQPMEQLAHPGPVDLQPGRQVRQDDGLLTSGIPLDESPVPPLEQQVHRLLVQLPALLGQVAAPPVVQGRHQSQEQRPGRQLRQPRSGADRLFQPARPPLGIRSLPPAHADGVLVPPIHEGFDLLAPEGDQLGLMEAPEPPALAQIGVGPAGDQQAAVGIERREVFDYLQDLGAALLCLRHLVQPIQHDQAAGIPQKPRQLGRESRQSVRLKLRREKAHQMPGLCLRSHGREGDRGHLSQLYDHR